MPPAMTFSRASHGRFLRKHDDVAKALGYANPQEATREHCKKVNKITQPSESLTSVKRPPTFINIIPESDVYRLVMRSNLPGAVDAAAEGSRD